MLNCDLLEFVESTLFLDITIESKLQWNPHIKVLAASLSSAANEVRKIRELTNQDTARSVYCSYFHSLTLYGKRS